MGDSSIVFCFILSDNFFFPKLFVSRIWFNDDGSPISSFFVLSFFFLFSFFCNRGENSPVVFDFLQTQNSFKQFVVVAPTCCCFSKICNCQPVWLLKTQVHFSFFPSFVLLFFFTILPETILWRITSFLGSLIVRKIQQIAHQEETTSFWNQTHRQNGALNMIDRETTNEYKIQRYDYQQERNQDKGTYRMPLSTEKKKQRPFEKRFLKKRLDESRIDFSCEKIVTLQSTTKTFLLSLWASGILFHLLGRFCCLPCKPKAIFWYLVRKNVKSLCVVH